MGLFFLVLKQEEYRRNENKNSFFGKIKKVIFEFLFENIF